MYKYKFKLDKPAIGKIKRSLVSTTFFGSWRSPRVQRVRGLPFRWFPYGELKKEIDLLDHLTKHFDIDGNAVIEAQPYSTIETAVKILEPICNKYNIGFRVSNDSDWNPGCTISILFFKNPQV